MGALARLRAASTTYNTHTSRRMSQRKRRRGNARARLQKQLEFQRELEKELAQLNSGKDQGESAKEIIAHVQGNGQDPMMSEENPFHQGNPGGCCCIIC